jgi:sigma-B regulation protein RsbU (phosphoserine phosphatase)
MLCASFALMHFYIRPLTPIVDLVPLYVSIFYYGNFLVLSFMLGAFAFSFYSATVNAEEKLEEEKESTNAALKDRNKALTQLNDELSEAANYVQRVLPQTIEEGAIHTDWRFVPSTSLGGDAFGYHKVDKDHFGIYLIDVSGHGVGAALLSISVINVLRSQSLPKTDFKDPAQVLRSLNLAFPSESNKDMFFTMWYGVYNQDSRELTYASGGHPPAILFNGNPSSDLNVNLLRTPNNVIGGMSESTFTINTCPIEEQSLLYVFSDGVYEVEKQDGSMWRFQEFTEYMQKIRTDGHEVLDRLYGYVKDLGNSETLEDDFTILEVAFT